MTRGYKVSAVPFFKSAKKRTMNILIFKTTIRLEKDPRVVRPLFESTMQWNVGKMQIKFFVWYLHPSMPRAL